MFGNNPDGNSKNNAVLDDLRAGITEFFESAGEESKETLTQARDFLREKLEEMDQWIKDYDKTDRMAQGGGSSDMSSNGMSSGGMSSGMGIEDDEE